LLPTQASSRVTKVLPPDLKVLSSGASAEFCLHQQSQSFCFEPVHSYLIARKDKYPDRPLFFFGSSSAYAAELIINWAPSAVRVTKMEFIFFIIYL
jgi:hypothetical protein